MFKNDILNFLINLIKTMKDNLYSNRVESTIYVRLIIQGSFLLRVKITILKNINNPKLDKIVIII